MSLEDQGFAVIRGMLDPAAAAKLLTVSSRCLEHFETGAPARFGYTLFSTSVNVPALLEFGCTADEIACPFASDWEVNLDHSWIRKRYAPALAPAFARPNIWHQDGALGVRFTQNSEEIPEMNRLITCWIALQDCRGSRPALELIAQPLSRLLHYAELDDGLLRKRFTPSQFVVPELQAGDAVVFLDGTLHRTWQTSGMTENRISLEYRLFPPTAPSLSSGRRS